jgi:amino acid transporter
VTALNAAGLRLTASVQRVLFLLTLTGLAAIVAIGAGAERPDAAAATATAATPSLAAVGAAMILVLFTYGGWNEAAYVSAEVKNPERNMARALVISIGVITLCYLLVNWSYVRVLGLERVASTSAVASDLVRVGLGDGATGFMTVLVLVIVLKSMNVATLTGARTAYALGRDTAALRFLGHWNQRHNAPRRALALQCAAAMALVGFGAVSRDGIQTTIDFLSPVFWLFFLLTGIALFVLRAKFPAAPRPFRVPLYPVIPLLFCISSAFMLYASIRFAGAGALVGLGVLAAGVPLMLWARRAGP